MIFNSYYFNYTIDWWHWVGTTNGKYNGSYAQSEVRVNCSQKVGPYERGFWLNLYDAVCCPSDFASYESPTFQNWARGKSCPKGWGRNKGMYPDDTYTVQAAQGCSKGKPAWTETVSKPVYGYVTRYRDKYYDYVAGRIAKS